MAKSIRYFVSREDTIESFTDNVNKYLDEGCELVGGISTSFTDSGSIM